MGTPHPTSSGTRYSAPGKELASSYQLVSSDNPNDLPEQRAPIHVPVALLLKDHEQELLQSFANKKEKVIDKVDHAKLANVVSISASVAILLGAFATFWRVAGTMVRAPGQIGGEECIRKDKRLAAPPQSSPSDGQRTSPWRGLPELRFGMMPPPPSPAVLRALAGVSICPVLGWVRVSEIRDPSLLTFHSTDEDCYSRKEFSEP